MGRDCDVLDAWRVAGLWFPAMNLGRVIGTVVATQKYEGLAGCKLLLVQPLDHEGRKAGDYLVAVDTVRAGVGELIYFVNSREAALALTPWFVPVDAAIVGIVDEVAAAPLPAGEPDVFSQTNQPAGPSSPARPPARGQERRP